MKKLIFITICHLLSFELMGQLPKAFFTQTISIPHGTNGFGLGFKISDNFMIYGEYKFEFLNRVKYTNETKQTFWTNVPMWYSEYTTPKPNESIYVIGSWGNVEIDKGNVKETYYSKFGQVETNVKIINFGLAQTLTDKWFIQYGLGIYQNKQAGEIYEHYRETYYDVHKVYDTWHVIHQPGQYYTLTSNYRNRILIDNTEVIKTNKVKLNLNLVFNYQGEFTPWIWNFGMDTRNGLLIGFGYSL